MIQPKTFAKHALLAYDKPNIVVDNAAAHVSIVGKTTLVAIAGTNDFKDAWADMKAMPWKPEELGVWVHAGFWFHTKKLLKPVLREIYLNGLPVAFGAHSLGGQVSYMLAALCTLRGLQVSNITTFGCPRGGFTDYNKITEGIEGKRFVRDGDQVAAIPTILGWSHDREATILEGADGVVDHPMQGYIDSL